MKNHWLSLAKKELIIIDASMALSESTSEKLEFVYKELHNLLTKFNCSKYPSVDIFNHDCYYVLAGSIIFDLIASYFGCTKDHLTRFGHIIVSSLVGDRLDDFEFLIVHIKGKVRVKVINFKD